METVLGSDQSVNESAPKELRLSRQLRQFLRCPKCTSDLENTTVDLRCLDPKCGARFPIVDGVAALINEEASAYSIDDVLTSNDSAEVSRISAFFRRVTPKIDANIKAAANYQRFAQALARNTTSPRVLVIGGRLLGQGMEWFASESGAELVETDIRPGPRTALICDAHNIPFQDKVFDGVIIQAVLHHVVDPYKCSDEIHRVLTDDGLVYAESPFMQQVHGAAFDFTRFTHLGHRRLFRRFDELNSGVMCGPGMALASSYMYFLLSFTNSRRLRKLLRVFAVLTSFYLKYFDYYLVDKPAAYDAASGYYFLGTKTHSPLPDRELIRLYKGGNEASRSPNHIAAANT